MPLYECLACANQKQIRIRPLVCFECGRPETYSRIDTNLDQSSAVCALDIIAAEPERFETGDSELDVILAGGFVKPSTSTIFGRGGTGKSRSALRWGTNLGVTLLISLEMPASLAVYSAKSARANLSRLHVTENEFDWQQEADRLKASCVIFDSFHYSSKQRVLKGSKVPIICYELSAWAKAKNAIVFMIAHSNKRNEVSGTTAVEHWPDYLLKFAKHGSSEAKVTIPKARYCPTGSAVITI